MIFYDLIIALHFTSLFKMCNLELIKQYQRSELSFRNYHVINRLNTRII